MPTAETVGVVFQSCSMPLSRPEEYGSDATGRPVKDYCGYCYQNGAFTNPNITLENMIDLCTGIMVKRGMPEAQAHAMLTDTIPGLKRWVTDACRVPIAAKECCCNCGEGEC